MLPETAHADCAVPDTGSATNHRPQFTQEHLRLGYSVSPTQESGRSRSASILVKLATKLLRQFSTFVADDHVLFKHDLIKQGMGQGQM